VPARLNHKQKRLPHPAAFCAVGWDAIKYFFFCRVILSGVEGARFPRGVAGSAIDFLICAIALRRNWQIFTTDRDFIRYAEVLALKLYNVN